MAKRALIYCRQSLTKAEEGGDKEDSLSLHFQERESRMDAKRNPPVQSAFGSWFESKMKDFGWNRTETATKLGVTKMTVGRWVNGRVPEASYIERIADVFLVDYDLVATKAGYRPPDFRVDPDSAEGQLVPIIRQIAWDDRSLKSAVLYMEGLAKAFPKKGHGDE